MIVLSFRFQTFAWPRAVALPRADRIIGLARTHPFGHQELYCGRKVIMEHPARFNGFAAAQSLACGTIGCRRRLLHRSTRVALINKRVIC